MFNPHSEVQFSDHNYLDYYGMLTTSYSHGKLTSKLHFIKTMEFHPQVNKPSDKKKKVTTH